MLAPCKPSVCRLLQVVLCCEAATAVAAASSNSVTAVLAAASILAVTDLGKAVPAAAVAAAAAAGGASAGGCCCLQLLDPAIAALPAAPTAPPACCSGVTVDVCPSHLTAPAALPAADALHVDVAAAAAAKGADPLPGLCRPRCALYLWASCIFKPPAPGDTGLAGACNGLAPALLPAAAADCPALPFTAGWSFS